MPTSRGVDVATFAPLTVRAVDDSGRPAADVDVTFVVTSKPSNVDVQIEPGGANSVTVRTDQNGVATLNALGGSSAFASNGDGVFTITATYGPNSVSFTNSMVPLPLTATGYGYNQSVPRTGALSFPGGQARFAPVSVRITDATGRPVSGVRVDFKPQVPSNVGMKVQMDPMATAVSLVSDADGMVTLNLMGGGSFVAYYAEGPFAIVATPAQGAPLTMPFTVAPSAAPPPPIAGATVSLVSGDGQRLPCCRSFAPLMVLVRDSAGQPLAGVGVTFRAVGVPGRMTVQLEPTGGDVALVPTDANGVAALNRMPGGSSMSIEWATGAFQVEAVYGTSQVVFNATVTE